MKKITYIFVSLLVIIVVWIYLKRQPRQGASPSEPTNTVTEASIVQPETNVAEAVSNAPIETFSQTNNTVEITQPLINAMTATNLEQWKTAIKGLKKLGGFTLDQHWLVEQPGRKTGLPIVLSKGDKTVQYSAVLISVNAENETGDITQIKMQTPNLNIDETRELGLKICDMLGHDPSNFLAWCDKVGNHWLDAPLYDGFSVPVPNSNKFNGFGILRGYNNGKPWIINFFITDP